MQLDLLSIGAQKLNFDDSTGLATEQLQLHYASRLVLPRQQLPDVVSS